MARRKDAGGKLRIGDHWSAISIIAQSQDNPLKAVAEFVENSIDAGAKNIHIVRGRQRNEPYLKVIDDGEGVRPDETGAPERLGDTDGSPAPAGRRRSCSEAAASVARFGT